MVAKRHFVNHHFQLRDLGGDFDLKPEAAGNNQYVTNDLAPKWPVSVYHTRRFDSFARVLCVLKLFLFWSKWCSRPFDIPILRRVFEIHGKPLWSPMAEPEIEPTEISIRRIIRVAAQIAEVVQ